MFDGDDLGKAIAGMIVGLAVIALLIGVVIGGGIVALCWLFW